MLSIPADGSGSPRICPACGEEIDSRICKKCGVKTFDAGGLAGTFVAMRKEKGSLATSELLKASKLGYDLRVDMSKVENERAFKRDLQTYFEALEKSQEPDIIVFSRDHRDHGELFQGVFEEFAGDSPAECSVVYGPLSTTMSAYLGALVSWQEKGRVMALHATASHNPPNYNGIKVHGGRFKRSIFPGNLEFSKQVDGEAVTESYVQWCTGFSPYQGELTLDLANGAASICMPAIADKLFPKAKFFNDKLLPDFGGVRPEPKWFVGWPGFGVAFDGDADRAPFYHDSKMIFFSRFLAGMVKEGLVDEKRVISDQRTPPNIIRFLEDHGVEVSVGHIGNTNQVALSRKLDALWFEENWHSGGYPVDGKRFHWGEAPFAVAFWLDKLTAKVPDLLEGVPEFNYTEEKFQVEPGFNGRAVDAAEGRGLDYAVLLDGGVRLEDDKGHILIRESNTEIGTAKLFATGVNPEALKGKLEFGRELIASIKGEPSD